ncbi:MAG TPA: nuclear transport factor 2 family protein [Candidatus Angelobacter sp.]
MPHGALKGLFSFMVATAVLAATQEPVSPKLTPTIITATKQVILFTGLERQVLQAIQKKDKSAVEAMTTDDFQIEMPDADPLAGPDWLDSVASRDFTLKSFVLRQMSVADLGDAAVVKYDRIQQATFKGKNDSGEFFVIDLWKKSGDSWRLANRYVARIAQVPASQKIQPKPTGKE